MPTLNIAHRGGAGLWPENSLAAFKGAVGMGADGAELDVQLSKEGEVVVFHDYRLKPEIVRDAKGSYLTKPTPLIKDLTLRELRTYDIGRPNVATEYGRQHPGMTPIDGERIPTLREVVKESKKATKPFWLQVELKTSDSQRELGADPIELAEAVAALLQAEEYAHRVIMVGFDWPGLLHMKKISNIRCWFSTSMPPSSSADPEGVIPQLGALTYGMGELLKDKQGSALVRAVRDLGGDGWFPFFGQATKELLDEARNFNLKVGTWTVNATDHMEHFSQLGLDAICTDRPDLFPKKL